MRERGRGGGREGGKKGGREGYEGREKKGSMNGWKKRGRRETGYAKYFGAQKEREGEGAGKSQIKTFGRMPSEAARTPGSKHTDNNS